MYRLFAFLLCISVVIEGTQFRSDYTYYQEVDGWLKLHIIPATWNDARLRCFLEGANLASPVTKEMQEIMEGIQKGRVVYTGINAIFSKHDYFTIEGVPLSEIPAKWLNGQPDNSEDKDACAVMYPSGHMVDVRCSELHTYICYKKNTKAIMTECGTIDPEYKLDNSTGSCYKFHALGQEFSRAFMTCSAEGGHLAIINSEVEAKVLVKLFDQYPQKTLRSPYKDSAMLGFHDLSEYGTFLTIHGKTLKDAGYAIWSKGQPDNAGGNQYCGSIFRNGLLDDIWCNTKNAFICEKSPHSLLDNNIDIRGNLNL